jgi:hypothetical protein
MAMGTGVDATTGMPVIMGNTGTGDGGLLGGGGIGALLIGALLFGNGGLGGFGNRGGYGMGGAAPVATGVDLGQLAGIQAQLTSLTNQANIAPITNELESMETTMNQGLLAVIGGIKDNANTYLQGQAALQTAQASANFTTLQSINGLGQVVTAQNNQSALQQLNSFNQLNTTVLQSFNENSRDNANSFNAIQASQSAAAAQLAECCCTIRAAIASDGDATRALINSLNVQALQVALQDAKTQNIILNGNLSQNLQTQTLINALKPASSTVIV